MDTSVRHLSGNHLGTAQLGHLSLNQLRMAWETYKAQRHWSHSLSTRFFLGDKPYLPADTDGMLPYDSKKLSSVALVLGFVLEKLLEMCGTMLNCKTRRLIS